MKVKGVHHIGVAVNSIDDAINNYRVLDFKAVQILDFPPESVKVAFLKNGETLIELLEPLGETSTIKKFIEKKGEGVHHICFEVENFQIELNNYKNIIIRGPKMGAAGRNICFLNPRGFNSVLIELIE